MKKYALRYYLIPILVLTFVCGCSSASKPRWLKRQQARPIHAKVCLVSFPPANEYGIPLRELRTLFADRLKQIIEIVVIREDYQHTLPKKKKGVKDPMEAAALNFQRSKSLDPKQIEALVQELDVEFLGIFTVDVFGQKWASMERFTEVGFSFILYDRENGSEVSRRFSLIQQRDSLRGQSFEAAEEKAVRALLKQTAKDLRKTYPKTPRPKAHVAENPPPANDIVDWLKHKWMKITGQD